MTPPPGWSVVVGAVFLEEFAALAGAVGVAGEGEDFGVVDEAVDHRGGEVSSPKTSPQRPKGRLEVTMTEPCS